MSPSIFDFQFMNFQYTLILAVNQKDNTSPVRSMRRVPHSEKENVIGLTSLHPKEASVKLRTKESGSWHCCLNSRRNSRELSPRLASATALYSGETVIARILDRL